MDLLKTYLKLTIKKNKMNYIYVILSIIAAYIIIFVLIVYMDNVLLLGTDFIYRNLHFIYTSIRMVFIIGGISFIINQYHNIVKAGFRDYCILKTLGATHKNICILIYLQIILLIVITIPAGLFFSYIMTSWIMDLLKCYPLRINTEEAFRSAKTFCFIAGASIVAVISTGIYVERGIRKIPLANILSDNHTIGKGV